MFDVFAEANTSAGAPARICSRRADEAPKFSSTEAPGLAPSNAVATSSKASVSEAAANTVIEPDTVSSAGASVVPALSDSSSSPPQAAAASSRSGAASRREAWMRCMEGSRPFD